MGWVPYPMRLVVAGDVARRPGPTCARLHVPRELHTFDMSAKEGIYRQTVRVPHRASLRCMK